MNELKEFRSRILKIAEAIKKGDKFYIVNIDINRDPSEPYNYGGGMSDTNIKEYYELISMIPKENLGSIPKDEMAYLFSSLI